MKHIQYFVSAVVIFVLSGCHPHGLEGTSDDPASSTQPPANPLPEGCEFEVGSIPSYTPPHPTVSQKHIPHAGPSHANVVADAPVGRLRRVSFSYYFSGLQNVVPPNFNGSFKISSTQVTVFEGPTVAYGQASSITFNDGTGNVMLADTSVTEGPNAFQDLWTIRVESTGSRGSDATQTPQPVKVVFLCAVLVDEPAPPTVKP